MIRIVIKNFDSIKTIKNDNNLTSKNEPNYLNERITGIESLYNTLTFPDEKKKLKNLIKFLKNFSEGRKLDKFLLQKLSEMEKVFLGDLFEFEIFENKNYEKNFFFLKRGFKIFHKEILAIQYHSKNLNAIRKCFIKINQKIFSDFVLTKKKNISEKEKKENFLNFYFNFPNENLKEIILYSLESFKKVDSKIIFCYVKYKEEFMKNLILLKNEKWEFFRKNYFFFDVEGNRNVLSHCILVDHVVAYFEKLFY